MNRRVLVAGVGNIFLSDDGFGIEVARRLTDTPLPAGVSVVDVGIRGVHLAYQLLDGYDTLILVDAAARGAPPGTLFVIEPELDGAGSRSFLDAHSLDPLPVLALLQHSGGHIDRVLIVGCEPAELCEGIGLSAPVRRAIDEALCVIRDLIDNQLTGAASCPDHETRKEIRP